MILTAHVVLVALLSLQALVNPHKFLRVERTDEDFVALSGRLHIVAKGAFDDLGRCLAVVAEADAGLEGLCIAL